MRNTRLSGPKLSYLARSRATRIIWALARSCILICVCFVLLYPIIYMFSTAIKPPRELTDPSVVWVARRPTFENIVSAYKAMAVPLTLGNTVLVCISSSFLQIIVCMFVGYGFAQFKFRGRGVVFALVVFTIIMPQNTLSLPMYLNFQNVDLFGLFGWIGGKLGVDLTPNFIGTPWAYILPSALGMGLKSGLFIFIYRQFFRGLPRELSDAARIDGCNAFQTFVRVMAPNAIPAILTVFLFSMVWYWNEYYYPQMFLGNWRVISTALASLRQNPLLGINMNDPYQYATKLQAGALISIAPMLIMYIVFQRYFTESVERTGIVG